MGADRYVTEICEECDDSVDVGGRTGCRHIGAMLESGGQTKWVPSCCGLRARQMDPTQGCANPETPHKWDGAKRPEQPKTESLPVLQPSAIEGSVRACLGHIDEPPCPLHGDGWMCGAVGRSIAPDLANPTGCCVVNRKPAELRRADCMEAR